MFLFFFITCEAAGDVDKHYGKTVEDLSEFDY